MKQGLWKRKGNGAPIGHALQHAQDTTPKSYGEGMLEEERLQMCRFLCSGSSNVHQ